MKNYEYQVRNKVANRPYLIPIFDHVYDIPRRIKEYDSSFFVVFNKNRQKYEIHSLEYPEGDTKSCTVPHDELDARTLTYLWENDIRVHGTEIFKRIEWEEERYRRRKEYEAKKFTQDFAKEFQSSFAKDAWM